MSEGGDKTEEPTQKKIDDSRKKGQVWKSKDLTGVAVFLVGLGTVKASWDLVMSEFSELFRFSFAHIARPEDLGMATSQLLLDGLTTLMILSLPVAVAGAIAGGLVEFLQVGPLFSAESIMPKFDKLNFINGMKNLVGKKQIVETVKQMIKISITAYVVYGVVRDGMGMVAATTSSTPQVMMAVMGELTYRVCARVGLCFLLFGVFDVWWQRKTYMKDMMMSKDEVKKEYKESEGDPHHKAKRKEFAMELLESAQMDAVKGADVIVTNPDHVAVALKYDRAKDGAPRVLCKGLDLRAQGIKALARTHDVAILRNVPLAHSLHRIDVGEEIPEDLYDAVAEVLNFVWGLKQGGQPDAPVTA